MPTNLIKSIYQNPGVSIILSREKLEIFLLESRRN